VTNGRSPYTSTCIKCINSSLEKEQSGGPCILKVLLSIREQISPGLSVAYRTGMIGSDFPWPTGSFKTPTYGRRFYAVDAEKGIENPSHSDQEVENFEAVKSSSNLRQTQQVGLSQVYDLENLKKGRSSLRRSSTSDRRGESTAYITDAQLEKLVIDLRRQNYPPKVDPRVALSKIDGGGRVVGNAVALDKVVQVTLRNLLTPLLEPMFSEYSYGFRPRRGCHDALHAVKFG
jgi:hypothetical protein